MNRKQSKFERYALISSTMQSSGRLSPETVVANDHSRQIRTHHDSIRQHHTACACFFHRLAAVCCSRWTPMVVWHNCTCTNSGFDLRLDVCSTHHCGSAPAVTVEILLGSVLDELMRGCSHAPDDWWENGDLKLSQPRCCRNIPISLI